MSSHRRRTRSTSTSSVPSNPEPSAEGPGIRQARLERILQDELQSLLTDEAADPSLEGVRLLGVQLSPDGGHARVAYAVVAALDREQAIAQASRAGLARATRYLRARLAQQLDLKKLPQLSFTFVGVTTADVVGGEPWPG
jgi:ribosome-binding factor A